MAITVDFSTYQGDGLIQTFQCLDSNGIPVDITDATAITWSAFRAPGDSPVLLKSLAAGNITIDNVSPANGKFSVAITSSDTQNLSDYYQHTGVVTLPATEGPTTYIVGRMQVGPQPIWTYSGDPSTSDRDYVRFLIGDTNSGSPQLTNPEIDKLLIDWPQPMLAASKAARALGGKYARLVNKRVGDLSINYSDTAKQYNALAAQLEYQAGQQGVTPYVGGVSVSDMNTVDSNQNRNKPPFGIGQFDYYPPAGEAGSSQTEGGPDWGPSTN